MRVRALLKAEEMTTKVVLILSCVTAVLAAYSAMLGFCDQSLYQDVIETGVLKISFMAGTRSQDIITILLSVSMWIIVCLYMKMKDFRLIIAVTGLFAYFFYAYGTYVISGIYTSIYLVYMAILTLSAVGVILGLAGFQKEEVRRLHLPKPIRFLSCIFLTFIVFLFVGKWTASILPYTQNHTIPEFYAVYILDLCIVMPFFFITVLMLVRNLKFGYILLGTALLKTVTLMLAVSIGSFLAPGYGTREEFSMIVIYCSLTIISFLLYLLYSKYLKYSG